MNDFQSSDREEIRHLVSLYTTATDRSAYHELANCISEDCELIICDTIRMDGRATIIERLSAGAIKRGALAPGNFQRHNVSNSILNVTGDRAKSVHYVLIFSELGLDHSGLYIDDFERRGGRWWMVRRQANMEWARPDSRFFTFPGLTYVATPEQLDIGLYPSGKDIG